MEYEIPENDVLTDDMLGGILARLRRHPSAFVVTRKQLHRLASERRSEVSLADLSILPTEAFGVPFIVRDNG